MTNREKPKPADPTKPINTFFGTPVQPYRLTSIFRGGAERGSNAERMLKQAEKDLELRILYCVGDSSGPLSDQSRIGIASRRRFEQTLKDFQMYRSAEIAVHFAPTIRGEGKAKRLQAALMKTLGPQRLVRDSWWKVSGQEAREILDAVALNERIEFVSPEQAEQIERAAVGKAMSQMIR